ncbi:MAG: hypothetical protein ABIH39_01445 [Candidatus Margulisiibacteriota bacterium]
MSGRRALIISGEQTTELQRREKPKTIEELIVNAIGANMFQPACDCLIKYRDDNGKDEVYMDMTRSFFDQYKIHIDSQKDKAVAVEAVQGYANKLLAGYPDGDWFAGKIREIVANIAKKSGLWEETVLAKETCPVFPDTKDSIDTSGNIDISSRRVLAIPKVLPAAVNTKSDIKTAIATAGIAPPVLFPIISTDSVKIKLAGSAFTPYINPRVVLEMQAVTPVVNIYPAPEQVAVDEKAEMKVETTTFTDGGTMVTTNDIAIEAKPDETMANTLEKLIYILNNGTREEGIREAESLINLISDAEPEMYAKVNGDAVVDALFASATNPSVDFIVRGKVQNMLVGFMILNRNQRLDSLLKAKVEDVFNSKISYNKDEQDIEAWSCEAYFRNTKDTGVFLSNLDSSANYDVRRKTITMAEKVLAGLKTTDGIIVEKAGGIVSTLLDIHLNDAELSEDAGRALRKAGPVSVMHLTPAINNGKDIKRQIIAAVTVGDMLNSEVTLQDPDSYAPVIKDAVEALIKMLDSKDSVAQKIGNKAKEIKAKTIAAGALIKIGGPAFKALHDRLAVDARPTRYLTRLYGVLSEKAKAEGIVE